MHEEFRTIPVSPSYRVSESGHVRRIESAKFLQPCRQKRGGYLAVSLWEKGKSKTWPVHQIVAITFHGPRPSPKHDVAHSDGDKENNHFTNLRWATRAENERDKIAHGKSNRGERNGLAKLTDAQTQQIIFRSATLPLSSGGKRIRKGELQKLGAEFGITASAVWQIINGYRRVPA